MNFNNKFLIKRIIVAAVIYLGTLLLAELAGVNEYGKIAFLIFLVKSIPVFTLGLNQGLIYYIFEKKISDYLFNYVISYLVIAFIIIVIYAKLFSFWHAAFSLILFFIILAEPFLKTKRYFLVMLYPEVILVAAFLLERLLIQNKVMSTNSYWAALILTVFFAVIFLIKYLNLLLPEFLNSFEVTKMNLHTVFDMIKRGFASSAYGLFFFLFLFVDRSMVEQLYSASNLSVLMLAYQIALISGFVITTLNVTAIVDIGEKTKLNESEMYQYVKMRFIKMLLLGFACYMASILLMLLLKNYIFLEYKDLMIYISIIGGALIFFNAYSAISSILFFKRKQLVPTVLLSAASLISYFNHNILNYFNFSLISIELINYSVFSLVMIVSTLYVFRITNKGYIKHE